MRGYWSLVERGLRRPSLGALRKAGEVLGLRDLVRTLDLFWVMEDEWYFPEAALVLYLTLDPIVRQLGLTTTMALGVALWVTLGICIVFCWLYLRNFWKVSDRQAWISIGAFVLYIAAIGGPFSTIKGYKTLMGTAAAVIATAFLLFVPTEDTPAPPD